MNIKPIPTTYRGITFRSKLEAHWAVYFDRCGVNWEYEPQGFDLGDGIWYLPDFLLHDVIYWDGVWDHPKKAKDLWVEVKGVMEWDSIKKIETFAFGDRETQIMNLKKAAEERLKDSRFDFVFGLRVSCPIQRPILVVGKMPLRDDFDGIRSLSGWAVKTFGEARGRRLFYFGRTVANYKAYFFPGINRNGKMELLESHLMNEAEFEQTMEALDYARNYRFNHQK